MTDPHDEPTAPDLDEAATDPLALASEAARVIAARTGVARHDVALVLGSGWGGAADLVGETVAELASEEVPGFTAPAVAGHTGTLRSVRYRGPDGKERHALVLGSRTHLYEGRGVRRVVHGVRTAAATGARTLVLTNGCGGLDPHWTPGTAVLIRDHINLTGASPLEGPTFVDLTDLYSGRLRALVRSIDPSIDEGVYVQFRGPQYETPAEVAMAGRMGGHLVGMSTALEAIAARHVGMDVLGLSLVTNHAAGIGSTPLSHAEVLAAGAAAGPRISALLAQVIRRL